MAVLRGGLLGNSSGKVAGIVTGQWKDKNYARAYVVPSNPNTAAQQAKRTRFKLCALFGMSIVGNILQPYMDTFLRSMSGFNWFIKTNIALFVGTITYSNIIVTKGSLFAAAVGSLTSGAGVIHAAFSAALGSNGLASDKVYACLYHHTTGRMFFASAEVLRSAATIDIPFTAGLTGAFTVYIITARRNTVSLVVTAVSQSSAADITI